MRNKPVLISFFRRLLLLEPLVLLLLLVLFWFPIEIRYQWLPLLVLVPAIMLVRLFAYGRLFTRFPLDFLLIGFLLLGVLNLYLSPYTALHPMTRLYVLARPALGMALILYAVEYGRLHQRLDALLIATLVMVGLVSLFGLFASDWTTKSNQLRFIINALPPFDVVRQAVGKFNVNEVGGALVWLVPLSFGLAAWRGTRRFDQVVRWGFTLVFVLCALALFLGQSRFAIIGVFISLAVAVPLITSNLSRRLIGWALIVSVIVLEVLIVRNAFSPPEEELLAERDDSSLSIRFDIWESAIQIVRKYPLTGVGMNMFREKAVRGDYPVPTFEQPVLPHTHNEYFQIAVDLGLPGLALFLAWYGVMFYGLYRVYRRMQGNLRAVVVGVAGGLLAHALFSVGDAITLWDRFAFIFWWLLALGSALYFMTNDRTISSNAT